MKQKRPVLFARFQQCKPLLVRFFSMRSYWILGFVALCVFSGHYLVSISAKNKNSHLFNIQELNSFWTSDTNKPKIILYWTGFYDQKDMLFGFGQKPFVDAGCKITNCWATDDRSLLEQSDAIIFHAGQYNQSDFSSAVSHVFNWTMTHRRDSDIYAAEQYGAVRRKKTSPFVEQLPPYLPPGERAPAPENVMGPIKNHPRLAEKNKLIAWFCSNTVTHGHREDYIRQLSKYIPIDIYGKCGNLSCQRMHPKCDNLLGDYKFYISAENSLCPDYVSEKFYRALSTDVVPVVYGGADYSAYAPPHSYINVADFESPRHLAEYLQLLDKNEALYLKYFDWKKDYEVVRRPMNGWCDLVCRG